MQAVMSITNVVVVTYDHHRHLRAGEKGATQNLKNEIRQQRCFRKKTNPRAARPATNRRTTCAGTGTLRHGARSCCAAGAATRRRVCPTPARRSCGPRRTLFIGARGHTSGPCARGARPHGASRGGHPVCPGRRDGAVWALAGGGALCAVHAPPTPLFRCTTVASTRRVPRRRQTHTTQARRPTEAHRLAIEALSRSMPGGLATAAHPNRHWLYQAGPFRRRPGKK